MNNDKNSKSEYDFIKPYGDTLNDGIVQLSFTLPVENGARARKAAELYVEKLNFERVSVACSKKLSNNFTYFVVYARAIPTLDYSKVTASEVKTQSLNFYEINKLVKEKLNRHVVVIGATIGDDAHTVGIDAIMNMKGFNADYGLERYPEFEAHNLGSQIPPEDFIKKALSLNADALLVSQTVTQKDSHIKNFTRLIELLEAENLRSKFLLVAGGPRVTNDLALELGYDAGFGQGTVPSQVAAYIATTLIERKK